MQQSNARHAESFVKCDVPSPPARGVAVVACMDARLDTDKLLTAREIIVVQAPSDTMGTNVMTLPRMCGDGVPLARVRQAGPGPGHGGAALPDTTPKASAQCYRSLTPKAGAN